MRRGQLFERHKDNPILTSYDWPYTVNAVLNPGVAEIGEQTVLLVRVEDRGGVSHLSVARSTDGITNWEIDPHASFPPDTASYAEIWGVEDPRITTVGDEYFIAYTGFSQGGPLVCLAKTTDFITYERLGVIMPPEDKNAALFPQTFDGRWALIHRPVPSGSFGEGTHIWISRSPDLHHWGDHKVLIHARRGPWWDAGKVGLGPPPLLTDFGWLIMYHGVRTTAAGAIYRLGLALTDGNDPGQLIMRSSEWVFGPEADYERAGDVPGVVFPCGWILNKSTQTLRLYYGAADTSIAVATARLQDLLEYLHRHCICGEQHKLGTICPTLAAQ
jgi:predicted GH43/DUF377 family glycosyl hydrolase